jgi:hypothetical protein
MDSIKLYNCMLPIYGTMEGCFKGIMEVAELGFASS